MPLRFGGTRQFSGPPLNGFPSEKALRLVIKNREEFSDYWKRLTARASPGDLVPSFPEIDFSKEMVIVVAMGLRPSSGYGIIIDGTCEVDGQVEVFVMNIDATCVPAPAVGSAPADVVRLPRTDLPVVFRETQVGCKEWLERVQKFQRVTG